MDELDERLDVLELERLLDDETECVLLELDSVEVLEDESVLSVLEELLLTCSPPMLDEDELSELLIDEELESVLSLLLDRLLLIEEVLLLVEIDMLELDAVLTLDVDIDETDWLLAVLDEALLVVRLDSLVALEMLVFECVLDELLRLLELDRECVLLLVETLWLELLLSVELLSEDELSDDRLLLDWVLSVLPSKDWLSEDVLLLLRVLAELVLELLELSVLRLLVDWLEIVLDELDRLDVLLEESDDVLLLLRLEVLEELSVLADEVDSSSTARIRRSRAMRPPCCSPE